MPNTETSTSAGTPAAMPTALCDVDGCSENAVAAYTWDWGESGYACARHQVILQQRARSLRRGITFAALRPGAMTELSRTERMTLHARALSAEDETRDAKTRSLELYNANQVLSRELGLARTNNNELKSQLADLRGEIEDLVADKAELKRELGEKTNELVRLESLISAGNAQP